MPEALGIKINAKGLEKLRKKLERFGQQVETGKIDEHIAQRLLAATCLEWPTPPVKSGRLRASGSAFVGNKLIATTDTTFGGDVGTPIREWEPGDDHIHILYSTPKPASPRAKVFYVSEGKRWFDYAPYQHRKHKTRRKWIFRKKRRLPQYAAEMLEHLWKTT